MDLKQSAEDNAAATSKPSSSSGTAASQDDTAGDGATPPKAGEKVAVLETNLGTIIFKFLPKMAPKTVQNFEKLANQKFYDGTKFHRVIPGFMIQGGDPNTKTGNRDTYGTGGPGYTIDDEFSDQLHVRGIVSMAHTSAPNSGGSQFFICVAAAPNLDHAYSAFGQVVKGMDVVDKIVNLPRDSRDDPTPDEAVIKSVKIKTWPLTG
jgi:cyclophilin family peptidyl-prolyl cis-trans isomerase